MTEVASVLYGREDIRRRVEELGRAITGDYAGREPVLISVLKGGTMFLADLMRQLPLPLEVHFMAISRYGDAEESFGRVQILLDLDVDLAGRDVLLVEDIVDTGLTLSYLLSVLRARGSRLDRGLRAAGQGGSTDRAAVRALRRIRLPGPLRGGLRAGLRGAVPQPRRHPRRRRPEGAPRRPRRARAVAERTLRLPAVEGARTVQGSP